MSTVDTKKGPSPSATAGQDTLTQAKGQPIVRRAKRKKSSSSTAANPIKWHAGWQEIGSSAGELPADLSGEDQSRSRVERRVELSTEPTVLKGDGGRERQYLTASLEQRADDAVPRVFIGHNEGGCKAATLEEARRFAREILALVGERQT
jgi:hypothetical protein